MRKLLLLILLSLTVLYSYAQDTLKLVNGGMMIVRVDSVNKYDISYHNSGKDDIYSHRISKSKVATIARMDGRQATFFVMNGTEISPSSPLLQLPDDSMVRLGRKDADKYYLRYKGAGTGTFLATFPGSPALGLIVGISCVSTPPKEQNLHMPNPVLASNPAYHEGYAKRARVIKNGKVWRAFSVGLLINGILFAASRL